MSEAALLLVDDDAPIRRMLERTLTAEGYEVVAAADGGAALAAVERNLPDAIVLDVSMPGIDGYEACRRLREDHHLDDLPVVMLTAHTQDEDLDRGYALGIVAYVTKPFDPQVLVATVRDALAGTP
jgi:two-component system, OmpR family, response regulator MprA